MKKTLHFNELFQVNNKMASPKEGYTVQIGETLLDNGIWINEDLQMNIGGLNFTQLMGRFIQVQMENQVYKIIGISQS